MRAGRRALVALGVVLAAPTPAAGQRGAPEPPLRLSGYARALGGGQDLGYDPGSGARRSAFAAQVVRLKWSLERGGIRLSVHNRFQAVASSGTSDAVLGFGVSAAPARSVDLTTALVTTDDLRVWHDLDRLAVSLFVRAVDVTVGRQAITWGVATLFPVADLWTQFSPFELDTEEKPGTDAVRALLYPWSGVELDVVVADRGTRRDLSAGARATVELASGDVYLGFGKFWREVIALGGISAVTGSWKLRAEAAIPRDLDTDGFTPPRVTAGVDWISSTLVLSAEMHYNGLGATSSAGYPARLTDPAFARGETYFLGRYYAGAFASLLPDDRLTLSLGALGNLADPSVALLPSLNYDLGQRFRFGAGGLVSLGRTPTIPATGLPTLRSEYGTYGHFGYAQAAVYF